MQNTFILMLDGDINWKPSAIQLLLNDLLKNEQTGAVCARVMPSGAGTDELDLNFVNCFDSA